MDALASFRSPVVRPIGDPAPFPYLDSPENGDRGVIDLELEVWPQTAAMKSAGHGGDRLSRSDFSDGYWTATQLIAHHTVGGCSLSPGDLFGSGTLTGSEPDHGGSLMALSQGRRRPITPSHGDRRTFLEDGDTVIPRGGCRREGFRRSGLGECRGTVQPALTRS